MTTKNFKFLLTDLDGNPVIGANDLDYLLVTDSQPSSSYSVTISEDISGYYNYEVAGLIANESGVIGAINDNPARIISPDFYQLPEITTYDTDDIYGQLQSQVGEVISINRGAKYGIINLTSKEGSDLIHIISMNQDVSGWTNFTVQAYSADRLIDSSTPPLTGTYEVNVTDVSTGTLEIVIEKDVTVGQVPDGVSNINIYADVDAIDTNGYRRTIAELTINLRRDFNTNI